jgi:hypothetical protein
MLKGGIEIPTHKRIREQIPERRRGRYESFMDRSVSEDPHEIIRHIKKRQMALKTSSPPVLNKYERMHMEKEAHKHREWIRKRLIPKKLYFQKHNPNDPDFQKAVEGCKMTMTPKFNKVVDSYKNIMRTISDDPRDSNIENLRPN